MYLRIIKKLILLEMIFCICILGFVAHEAYKDKAESITTNGEFIKWVDFKVSYEALCAAYKMDVETHDSEVPLNWIDLLAYVATKNGGNFGKNSVKELEKLKKVLCSKEATLEELTKDKKYFPYYREAYEAILGQYIGEYEIEELDEQGNLTFVKKYGLKVFSPIAKGFEYCDYDDFGSQRSYGYRREHLGHDMMGIIGTPVVATESGRVEALGWNKYGGWRIGIRSFDQKRYYYYAHLRQNYPYAKHLEVGSVVTAGEVIGYMGHTGYSNTENVNNIDSVHLHFGIQLIFDESQKEGNSEIWIDCYSLARFLSKNRSEVVKEEGTKEWKRVYQLKDPMVLEEQIQKEEIKKIKGGKRE